jgi:hypothetical protein
MSESTAVSYQDQNPTEGGISSIGSTPVVRKMTDDDAVNINDLILHPPTISNHIITAACVRVSSFRVIITNTPCDLHYQNNKIKLNHV